MKKLFAQDAVHKNWLRLLLPIALVLCLSSCLESKPKVLGKSTIQFAAVDTANSETFRFNFAYRDPAVASPVPVYMQGIANSNSVMTTTCNGAGTGCQCEFLSSTSTVLGTATSSYDTTGNFFSCTYSGVLGSLAKVRLKNIAGTKVSDAVDVVTTLTPQVLVGTELDANKVRTVKNYACRFNYLEKHGTGTAPGAFNCTTSAQLCGTPPAPATNYDFCFVEITYPYYLYSDNYSTNGYKQLTDQVYNAGGSNVLCGRQAKQYDCTLGTTGVPLTKKFGLYSEQTGNFQVPVLLVPAPTQSTELYGFAAKVGASGNCPPGMIKKDFYVASIPAVAESSVPADTVTDISDFGSAPANLKVNRRTGDGVSPDIGGLGGYCNTNICYAPRRPDGAGSPELLLSRPYTAAGTPFCVIDPAILP